MSIQRIESGPRMSGAVIHNGVVYLSGQVGEGATVAEQSKSALAKVDALLAKAGTDKSKMLQCLIYLSDISTFNEMNKVWEAWIDPANPPARATSQAALAAPSIRVEFTIIAAL